MKVMFAGGGTMGPVTPLLAVVEAWRARKEKKPQFVWVGTKYGPEREVIREAGIRFLHLPVARLPRYPTIEWLLLPFRLLLAFAMAWLIIGRERPSIIVTAGGFTGVPLILAGWLRFVPSIIHQPDVRPLLSNRLAAPFAKRVTVAWEESMKFFPEYKTVLLGNPVRPSIVKGTKDAAHESFGIDLRYPTVMVFGGGSGAAWLNRMMLDIGKSIVERANVIHLTGRDKHSNRFNRFGSRYHAMPFLKGEMADALAAADVVVARAGMGTIGELSSLKKPAILVPIPGSGQVINAEAVKRRSGAMILPQTDTNTGDLRKAILDLLDDKEKREEFGRGIGKCLKTNVGDTMIEEIQRITKKRAD